MWKRVDLPQPDGPMTDTNSPRLIVKSKCITAGTASAPTP